MFSLNKRIANIEQTIGQVPPEALPPLPLEARVRRDLTLVGYQCWFLAVGVPSLFWLLDTVTVRGLASLKLMAFLYIITCVLAVICYVQFRERAAETIAREHLRQRNEIAAAQAQHARQAAEQRETALAQVSQQQRAVLEFRFKALKYMEDGILQLLEVARDRQEWIPESVDEERIYELIRQRIRQSGVPEYGILRRSFHPVVTMVLGDRSCLPPDPTDEQIMNRQLPPVASLLGARG